jgi:hypothetical protein
MVFSFPIITGEIVDVVGFLVLINEVIFDLVKRLRRACSLREARQSMG